MTVLHEADCAVEFLDDADTEALLDQVARRKMGISITEYRRRRAAGEYRDVAWDTVPGLVDVAMLAGH